MLAHKHENLSLNPQEPWGKKSCELKENGEGTRKGLKGRERMKKCCDCIRISKTNTHTQLGMARHAAAIPVLGEIETEGSLDLLAVSLAPGSVRVLVSWE